MSAHRRPALRDDAPGSRATALRGRRRAHSRSYRLLPVALGIGVLGIGAMAGPSVIGGGWDGIGNGQNHERITYAALPKDAPEQGMVYDGLHSAGPSSVCAGSYQLDAVSCTHGPDAAPAGLRVHHDVAPVTAKSPEPPSTAGVASRTSNVGALFHGPFASPSPVDMLK